MHVLVVLTVLWTHGQLIGATSRNLLSTRYAQTDVDRLLTTDLSWVPYPAYRDRASWQKLPAKIRKANIQLGEQYLDYDWPEIKATLYLEFVRSGNLENMKKTFVAKQRALENLVMAELMEGKGRFLDDIINGVWDL